MKLKEFLDTAKENREHENVLLFLDSHAELFLAILSEPPESFEDEALAKYLADKKFTTKSLLDLHQLFHQKKFRAACEFISDLSFGVADFSVEQIKTLEQLHLWALQYLPPAEKLRAIYTDYKIDPKFITQETRYRSIIDHAGPQIIVPLRSSR